MSNKKLLPSLVKASSSFRGAIPKEMVWTISSLRLFRTCKRKFFWSYLYRLAPKGVNIHLIVGTHFHKFVEDFLRSKRAKPEKIVAKHTRLLREDIEDQGKEEQYPKYVETVKWFPAMLMAYATIYRKDREESNPSKDIIEKEFCVQGAGFKFAGKIDHAKQIKGKWVHVEHKTTGRITGDYLRRLPLDAQIRGYVYGARNDIQRPVPVADVLYDVVLKPRLRQKQGETEDEYITRVYKDYIANPTKYFYREEIQIPDSDVLSFEHELNQTHSEYMWILEQSKLNEIDPLHARIWTPNDSSCYDYNKLCVFAPLCIQGLDKLSEGLYEQSLRMHSELSMKAQPEDK